MISLHYGYADTLNSMSLICRLYKKAELVKIASVSDLQVEVVNIAR